MGGITVKHAKGGEKTRTEATDSGKNGIFESLFKVKRKGG